MPIEEYQPQDKPRKKTFSGSIPPAVFLPDWFLNPSYGDVPDVLATSAILMNRYAELVLKKKIQERNTETTLGQES